MSLEVEITSVDEALQVARENKAHANFFYDTFLNATIFVPAQREDKSPGSWKEINASERFFPLYLRKETLRAVPVFDTLAKLQNWAGENSFDYLILPAYLFLKVIAKDVHVILNDNTPYRYEFTADILEKLRTAMAPVKPS